MTRCQDKLMASHTHTCNERQHKPQSHSLFIFLKVFRVAVQHDRQYYDIISDRHWIGYRLDSGALARVILRILRALQFIGHDRYRRAKTTLVLSSTHTNWMRFWCCFALMVYGPFYICQKTTDGIILNRWVHLSVPNWVKMNESRRRAHTNRPSSAHTHTLARRAQSTHIARTWRVRPQQPWNIAAHRCGCCHHHHISIQCNDDDLHTTLCETHINSYSRPAPVIPALHGKFH